MEKRISYYTRKVAEFTAIHPTKRRNQYRYERLMRYKQALNAIITK